MFKVLGIRASNLQFPQMSDNVTLWSNMQDGMCTQSSHLSILSYCMCGYIE